GCPRPRAARCRPRDAHRALKPRSGFGAGTGDPAEHGRDVHERARGVVVGLPLVGLAAVADQCTLAGQLRGPAAMLGVDDVALDELPLLEERVPVAIGLLAELPVHDQEGIETFGLGPPDLGLVVGLAGEDVALVVEPAELIVPAPVEGMIDEL